MYNTTYFENCLDESGNFPPTQSCHLVTDIRSFRMKTQILEDRCILLKLPLVSWEIRK
ncbi:hypothetical protein B0O99DRAFT_607838 [Bisporella sp. PMI_857]|nr:hypothetical protein B0O99DRAFT_607838 [Bisporella sp. PMI_857]